MHALAHKVHLFTLRQKVIKTRSSTTAEIALDAHDVDFSVDDHSRSLKVISYCANRRSIYDFLLALSTSQ